MILEYIKMYVANKNINIHVDNLPQIIEVYVYEQLFICRQLFADLSGLTLQQTGMQNCMFLFLLYILNCYPLSALLLLLHINTLIQIRL